MPEIDKKAVGERLKIFAKTNFKTVNGLAQALGISSSMLSGTYVSGRSLPGAELIAKLIAMGCDISWLLTGKESAAQVSVSVAGNKAKGSNNVQGNTGSVAMANPPVYIQAGEKSFDVSSLPENAVVINAGPSQDTAKTELLEKENEYLKQRIKDLEEIIALLKGKSL